MHKRAKLIFMPKCDQQIETKTYPHPGWRILFLFNQFIQITE